MTDSLFASQGAPYGPFKSPGDTYEGEIVSLGQVQATEYLTPAQKAAGKVPQPLTWPDGKPKMTPIVTVQTNLRDPEIPGDDGQRSLWLSTKGQQDAVRAAVKAAGASREGLLVGGWIRVTYTHDEQIEGVSNPAKRYEAEYRPPAQGSEPVNIIAGGGTYATQADLQAASPPGQAAGMPDLSHLSPAARAAVEAMLAQQGQQ